MFTISKDIAGSLYTAFVSGYKEAIADHGMFTVGLSGGSLVKTLAVLAKGREPIEWDKVHVFYVDERCVPIDHTDSNHFGAFSHFLSLVPIPTANIHHINPELVDAPQKAAMDYQTMIQATVTRKNAAGIPVFDLLLLGIGPDGHTCSLFPGHSLLDESKLLVASLSDSPKPPPSRITFTYPLLNAARESIFVVTGEGKKQIVFDVLQDGKDYPCARVKSQKVTWLLDPAAAQLIASDFNHRE